MQIEEKHKIRKKKVKIKFGVRRNCSDKQSRKVRPKNPWKDFRKHDLLLLEELSRRNSKSGGTPPRESCKVDRTLNDHDEMRALLSLALNLDKRGERSDFSKRTSRLYKPQKNYHQSQTLSKKTQKSKVPLQLPYATKKPNLSSIGSREKKAFKQFDKRPVLCKESGRHPGKWPTTPGDISKVSSNKSGQVKVVSLVIENDYAGCKTPPKGDPPTPNKKIASVTAAGKSQSKEPTFKKTDKPRTNSRPPTPFYRGRGHLESSNKRDRSFPQPGKDALFWKAFDANSVTCTIEPSKKQVEENTHKTMSQTNQILSLKTQSINLSSPKNSAKVDQSFVQQDNQHLLEDRTLWVEANDEKMKTDIFFFEKISSNKDLELEKQVDLRSEMEFPDRQNGQTNNTNTTLSKISSIKPDDVENTTNVYTSSTQQDFCNVKEPNAKEFNRNYNANLEIGMVYYGFPPTSENRKFQTNCAEHCGKSEECEPEWDYAADPFYTTTEDDESAFNIYTSNAFLMHEEDVFDEENTFLPHYYGFANDGVAYFNACGSTEDGEYNVEGDSQPLCREDLNTLSESDYHYYGVPYYFPFHKNFYFYHDFLRQFALWSLQPTNQRRFSLEDDGNSDEDDDHQETWFDRLSQQKYLVSPNDVLRQRDVGQFPKDCDPKGLDNKEGKFALSPTNPFHPENRDFQRMFHLSGEQFWNNPILKAREFYEKSRQKKESMRQESISVQKKPSPKQSLNVIRSEISKIEKKYRNRIHRVNDVYLEDIKEDAKNEFKEEKQTQEEENPDYSLLTNTEDEGIQISPLKQETNDLLKEVKITKLKGEDIPVLDSERTFNVETPGQYAQTEDSLENSKQKENFIFQEKEPCPPKITEDAKGASRPIKTKSTHKKKKENLNERTKEFDETKRKTHSSFLTKTDDNTSQFAKNPKPTSLGDSLPDLLASQPVTIQLDPEEETRLKQQQPEQQQQRTKSNFVKSGTFSYSATKPTMRVKYGRKTGSLKITKVGEGSLDASKRTSDSSFRSLLNRFMGQRSKNEEKGSPKNRFKFGPFKPF